MPCVGEGGESEVKVRVREGGGKREGEREKGRYVPQGMQRGRERGEYSSAQTSQTDEGSRVNIADSDGYSTTSG